MIKITTMSSLPPLIQQSFNSNLLSSPSPSFRQTSKALLYVYNYIETRLAKKVNENSIRKQKYENLKNQFLELYERIKTKEKELEGKTEHFTQRPFYFTILSNRIQQSFFTRLEYRAFQFRFRDPDRHR